MIQEKPGKEGREGGKRKNESVGNILKRESVQRQGREDYHD